MPNVSLLSHYYALLPSVTKCILQVVIYNQCNQCTLKWISSESDLKMKIAKACLGTFSELRLSFKLLFNNLENTFTSWKYFEILWQCFEILKIFFHKLEIAHSFSLWIFWAVVFSGSGNKSRILCSKFQISCFIVGVEGNFVVAGNLQFSC